MCGHSSTSTVGNSYATVEDDHVIHYILVLIAIIGTSVLTAHDGTCTRYGPTIDVLDTSCIDTYIQQNPTGRGRSGYCALKTDHLFLAYCDNYGTRLWWQQGS